MSKPSSKMRRLLKSISRSSSAPSSRSESKLLKLPALLVKNHIGSYFDINDLSVTSQTCTYHRDLYKNNCKATELLFYGLNINKARKKKLMEQLATPNVPSLMLERVNGRQVYFSKKHKQTVCTRIFLSLSQLEAAVLCGDFPLVRLLLKNLPDDQNKKAVSQLKSMRERLESDPRSFAALINPLHEIYKEFIDKYETLVAAKNWNELDRLSGLLGENQKVLPWFILQVFCKRLSQGPLLDFNQEPERECFLSNGLEDVELDLDSIGAASKDALYKGMAERARMYCGTAVALSAPRMPAFDSAVFYSLSVAIISELDKIIELQQQKLPLVASPNSGKAYVRSP